MQMVKKLEDLSQCAAIWDSGDSTLHPRSFLLDRNNNIKFLLDTGSEVTCIPALPNLTPQSKLAAINNTKINVYGKQKLSVDLGFNTPFEWDFIMADVPMGILGIDFLAHHRISIDPHNCSATHQPSRRTISTRLTPAGIFCVSASNNVTQLLDKFPQITGKAPPEPSANTTTYHHIITTG